MHIILFEDKGCLRLYPITTGRPAFSISVGSLRLIDLVRQLSGELEPVVRPHLKEPVREDYPDSWTPAKGVRKGPFLLINARTVPRRELIDFWKKLLLEQGAGSICYHNEEIVAAVLGEQAVLPHQELGCGQLTGLLQDMQLGAVRRGFQPDLLESPCDVIRYHGELMNANLQHRLAVGDYREIADGLFVPRDESVAPNIGAYFVRDTKNGPIVMESNVDVGPYCYLRGPVHLGAKTKVIERSTLKDRVAVGNVCKIGGEVESSTIESYTNKQHHGFLGHSYLGSWVNLGAGTCNSDLKNSYNEVWLDTAMGKIPSGQQFLGCVVGDYAKTAINTSIFTGKTIGTCSMVYGFVTTAVPSFVNYARSFGQVTELPVDVMIATQTRMFARRNVEPRPTDAQLIKDMYELTGHERQLASEPLSL